MLKESIHFKMAQTEVIRMAIVTITEVLSENLHELLKKRKIRRKRRWWVKNWVTQRHSLFLIKLSASANQNCFGTCMSSVPALPRSDFLIFNNSVE